MKHHDYDRAMACLENLELTPETEAMWGTLANACVKDQPPNLMIAERCYAALGDISKTRYLHKVNTIAEYARGEIGGDGTQHFMVRAKMAVLQHDFKVAENILVDQGQIDECLDMYQELHKWDEAIFVAEAKNHENAADLRSNYYTWLIDTGQ
jgi:intraflagellar transport protein 172